MLSHIPNLRATSLVSPHVSEFREEPIWMTDFSLVAVCG